MPTETPLAHLMRRAENELGNGNASLALYLVQRAAAALQRDQGVAEASRAAITERLRRLQDAAVAAGGKLVPRE